MGYHLLQRLPLLYVAVGPAGVRQLCVQEILVRVLEPPFVLA